jgi:hypothetical protein
MPTYEQVVSPGAGGAAGNLAGRNVFRVRFATNPCSDQPQLQAWDDYAMNSTTIESLIGTPGVPRSMVAAAHTTNVPTPATWVPAQASAGGGEMHGGGFRHNRLSGADSYLSLADAGDAPPAANEERFFQLALGCAHDSTPGTAGHLPVLAVKTFYAGAPPDVSVHYNRGDDDLAATAVGADWRAMVTEAKGTAMAMGVQNTIHATGPGTTVTALDPVTKPGSGEKWAEELWIQTAL